MKKTFVIALGLMTVFATSHAFADYRGASIDAGACTSCSGGASTNTTSGGTSNGKPDSGLDMGNTPTVTAYEARGKSSGSAAYPNLSK